MFQKYYQSYKTKIYWYIYSRIKDKSLAEDLTADVFVKLWQNRDKLLKEPEDKSIESKEKGVVAWLYTTARNTAIDHYRLKSTKSEKNIDPEVFEILSYNSGNYLNKIIRGEKNKEINKALNQLNKIEKEVLTLRYYDDLKIKEIAEVIDKKLSATKMTLYRALEKLKKEIK